MPSRESCLPPSYEPGAGRGWISRPLKNDVILILIQKPPGARIAGDRGRRKVPEGIVGGAKRIGHPIAWIIQRAADLNHKVVDKVGQRVWIVLAANAVLVFL